jgi:hypothetical protein
MLTALISLAVWAGVPQRFAKAAAIGAAVIAAVLLLCGGVALYDHSIIAKHDATQELKQERTDRKADNRSAEQRRADDARLTQERRQLEEASNNGQTDTDRRIAFYRCLRLQQQARDSGRPLPACK